MSESPPFSIEDAEVVLERPKALLVRFDDEEHWIPKSVIHDNSEVFDGDENSKGTLVVFEWFAEKNGWA